MSFRHRPRTTHASPSPPARSIMGMSTNGTPASPESIARATKQLAEMEKFATNPGCRRRAVLSHFGEDMGERRVFFRGCKNLRLAFRSLVVLFAGPPHPSSARAESISEIH